MEYYYAKRDLESWNQHDLDLIDKYFRISAIDKGDALCENASNDLKIYDGRNNMSKPPPLGLECEICKTITHHRWTVRTFGKTVFTFNVCRECIPRVPNIETGSIYNDGSADLDFLWYCRNCNEVYNTRNGMIDEKHMENCYKNRLCGSCGERTITFRCQLSDRVYKNLCVNCILIIDPMSQTVIRQGDFKSYIHYCSDCKQVYQCGENAMPQSVCEHYSKRR